eukprot:gene12159-13413_t
MLDFASPSPYLHVIIAVLILTGNCIVIYLYFSDYLLRKACNRFVISLAFSDLLVALVFIPCHEFFNEAITKAIHLPLSGYVASFASYGSLLNLFALTYDRYVATFQSLRYHALMTSAKTKGMVLAIWGLDVIITLLPLSWKYVTPAELNAFLLHIYQMILIIIIIIAYVMVTLVYMKIFMAVRHHLNLERRQTNRFIFHCPGDVDPSVTVSEEHDVTVFDLPVNNALNRLSNSRVVAVEFRAAKVVMAMFMVNTICWLPTVVLNIVYLASWFKKKPFIPDGLFQISKYCFLSYSIINPWVYALFKEDFSKSFRKKIYRRLCHRKDWI